MKYSAVLLVIFFLFEGFSTFAACQPRSSPREIKRIEDLLDQQARDWNNGDIAGYMKGYWVSDSLLFTSGGNVRCGWLATFEKYKKSYDTKSKMGKLTFSDLKISLLSSASAWVFGKWDLSREHDHPGGVFTLILKKFPAGWKIIHDHTSSFPPQDSTSTRQ